MVSYPYLWRQSEYEIKCHIQLDTFNLLFIPFDTVDAWIGRKAMCVLATEINVIIPHDLCSDADATLA